MAWNPSPEVAAARDAAKALNDAPVCVVVWMDAEGEVVGMASYGKTKALCAATKVLGVMLHKAAMQWTNWDSILAALPIPKRATPQPTK